MPIALRIALAASAGLAGDTMIFSGLMAKATSAPAARPSAASVRMVTPSPASMLSASPERAATLPSNMPIDAILSLGAGAYRRRAPRTCSKWRRR